MAAADVQRITLNNGNSIPVIGLCTSEHHGYQVTQAVQDAIDIGYRHIDCAFIYRNEYEVGEAITAKIEQGVIQRSDLFVTSKLWEKFDRPDKVKGAMQHSLSNLRVGYLDLYLMHWPLAYREGDNLTPYPPFGKPCPFADVDYVDTWKAMEKLVDAGLVKNIGLANFSSKQIRRVLNAARITPVVNQIENHPYLNSFKLTKFCAKNQIVVTAYRPLGSPARPRVKETDVALLEDETLKAIARKHGKEPAQVLIRYQIQKGHVVIPTSVNRAQIASNFDVFCFQLDATDMEQLAGLERNGRIYPKI